MQFHLSFVIWWHVLQDNVIWYDTMWCVMIWFDVTWRDVTWIAACASVFACSVAALWCNVSLSDMCHAFYCGVVCHSTSDMHDDEHDSRLLMKRRLSFDVAIHYSSLSLIWFCALFEVFVLELLLRWLLLLCTVVSAPEMIFFVIFEITMVVISFDLSAKSHLFVESYKACGGCDLVFVVDWLQLACVVVWH